MSETDSPEGMEFRRLLVLTGWTQQRAADELHLDRVTVSGYVNGRFKPSLTVLRLLAELVGDRVVLPGVTHVSDRLAHPDTPRTLEPWETEALMTLRRLNPDQRKRLLGIATDMVAPATYRKEPTRAKPAGSVSKLPLSPEELARHGAIAAGAPVAVPIVDPERRTSSKAALPSGNTSSPPRGNASRPNPSQSAPKPARAG